MKPGTDYARLSPERRKARGVASAARVRAERAAARLLGLCRRREPLRTKRDGELGSTCQGCFDATEATRIARVEEQERDGALLLLPD